MIKNGDVMINIKIKKNSCMMTNYIFLFFMSGCAQGNNDIPVFISPAVGVSYYASITNKKYTLPEQINLLWNEDYTFKVSKYNEGKNNESRVVDNCKSILKLHPLGYWPVYVPDTDIYNYLYAQCKAIDISIDLYKSNFSYVDDFYFSNNELKNLPKNMAFIPSTSTYNEVHKNQKIKTIEDVNHIVKVTKKSELRVIAEDDSGGIQDISILAKGDFNRDKLEDILFGVSNSVVGGSYTSYYLYVLTKTKNNGNWIVLDEYPKIN